MAAASAPSDDMAPLVAYSRARSFLAALLLLLACSGSVLAQPPGAAEAEYQRRFEAAMALVFAGQLGPAASALEALYRDTHSLRVKLEWARVYYLAGDYDTAARLFREVLAENPPLAVQDRINGFLNDIALRGMKLDYSFGLATDTNPRAVTSARAFDLFGNEFVYTPGVDTSPQYGVSYRLSAIKAFGAQQRWIGAAMISGSEFVESQLSNTTVALSLQYVLDLQPRLYVRPALELAALDRLPVYYAPFLAFGTNLGPVLGNAFVSAEVKFGRIAYPDFPYASSWYYGVTAAYNRYLGENVSLTLQLGLAKTDAEEAAYAFDTYSAGLSGIAEIPSLAAQLQLGIGYSYRPFDGPDVFFRIHRADHRTNGYATLVVKRLRALGFSPALEFSWERNASNIPLHEFERTQFGISLRKLY